MDTYQNFIGTLHQAISTRDFVALTNVLNNGQGFLAIVSLEHSESVVCSIFDRRDGFLCFLKYELENRGGNRIAEIDDALTKGFSFLEFFIENFYTTSCFVQYIFQIKDVCQLALTIKCNFYTQKAACDAFTKLIELFSNHDLRLIETVDNFVRLMRFNVYKLNESRLILCVLGKIIKYNGNVCSQNYCNKIFDQWHHDASKEYKTHRDFYVYFDVLADMLDGSEPSEKTRKKRFETYRWIKNFTTSQQDREQAVIRSAIDLLTRHMNFFQDLLYSDYKHWHEFLRSLSRMKTASGAYGRRALKKFYRVMGHILTETNSGDARALLVFFLDKFKREFENTDLDLTELQLIIYGFSQMAVPCKMHMEVNVRYMYSIITSYALPLCFSEQSHSTHVETICCYQEALSEILCHMTDVTIEKINVLIKLSIYTIKRFPDLVISNNALAVSALIKTISKLATINRSLLQQYLDNIIYDGIAWSCSHTLALDAELQRELNNLQQLPICYKNYLPLWMELLNIERYFGCDQMAQHVADTLMNVCIMLIGRLDIRVKRTNENTVYSDVAITQSALNQADFRVFTNLVDLYVDVIDTSEPSLFANTVCRFLYEIIKLSYKYPLVSGFYKLVRTGMKIFVARMSEEEVEEEENSGESQRVKELLSNYLTRTIDLIPTFSNELLIACLYLILDAPHVYLKDALPRTLPAFKIAFTVGLSNLELADTALTTLETWTEQERKQERTNELLREIVAFLEPYLRSTESSVEVSQDLTTMRSRVKRVELVDTKCKLRNFQRRVLLFLGSLDHDLLSSYVYDRASRSTGASWDRKNLLKYSLPLSDARLDIHFDRILPRIIVLARESSDRRTKIAACEVLHSMVALIVGSTVRHLSASENRFTVLYSTLCPAMLALGCDSDEVVRGLFEPLMLQLMRWLSSRLMLLSSVISPVLDSLFDNLTNDSNPALREFSGTCLAEFTRWSIRQAPEVQETQSNVHRIVRRINELALHPLMRKRVAAAIAFNHLYAILREDGDTVSIYWLEIFYCFVCSLSDECDDPSIANALAHIEKVMRCKADLLNVTDPRNRRRKPHEFEDATLTHALHWLLSRCGTLDECCRAKCMELYLNVSQYVDNPQKMIRIFVETYSIGRLNDIILKDLGSDIKDISVIGNVTPFFKALDYYIWLLKNQLLQIETLFPATNDAHIIFSCIRSFTGQWRVINKQDNSIQAIQSRELEQLQTLQCKTLIATLNFIQVLLNININVLPNSLWDDSLSQLTTKCIMHPRKVGFDIRNIEITDKLPHVLENLLNTMKLRLTYSLPNNFKNCLVTAGKKYAPRILNLHNITQDNIGDLIQHVDGLILLQRCDMLDRKILETSQAFIKGETMMMNIFEFLVSRRMEESTCRNLNARMIEYLRTLMEFQLSLCSSTIETPKMVVPEDTRSITDKLVRLISDDTPVIGADSAQITHGEYFLNIFKSVIFKFMLTHVGAITLVFDEMSRDKPSFLFRWLEDLLLYLKQHKRELQAHVDATVNAILRKFSCLENAVCNVDSRRERLMNIYGIVVRLGSEPVKLARNSAFYTWILNQLSDNGLEYKTQILQRFFICLTTNSVDDERLTELQAILRGLKNNAKDLCSNLSETSVNAMKVIDCFEMLLTLLSTTKSIIMLESVIHFATGTGDRLFRDGKVEEHLREYYRKASSEHVLRSLELTYSMFMNSDMNEIDRFDILNGFLLPTFKFCDAIAIEHFFERNIQQLYDYTDPSRPTDATEDTRAKQIIVSKIGCFQLITIMFATVDMNKLVGVNATIVRNALLNDIEAGKVQLKNGRELFQSLFIRSRDTRALSITKPGYKELMRLLHCFAYNCSLAIINLKEEEPVYRAVFGEDHAKRLFIWKNIVDLDKRYQLGQTFKEHPKIHEIAVNVRPSTSSMDNSRHRYAYVHSYDLSTSTLYEDINAYDFNRSVLLSHPGSRNLGDSHGATSVVLESDDFNQHECMPYICVLLRRMKEVCKSSDKLPKCMALFRDTLLSGYKVYPVYSRIVTLFLLRIVYNTIDVFKSYAKFMLTPIVETVANYLERDDLNYIITDILEILMDWHDVAMPCDEDDRKRLLLSFQRLFEALIKRALKETSNYERRVYDYNLSLIKTIVEKWHSYLRVPNVLLNEKMISAPKAAVYLILVLLDNGMTKEIVPRDDIVEFLLKPLNDWNTSETDKTPLQCSECLGLYLNSLDKVILDEIEREGKKCEIKQKIFNILGPYKHQNIIKQVKRIAVLCRTYPEIAIDQRYIHVAHSAIAKNIERPYCLEILTLAMPRFRTVDQSVILNNVRHMGLQKVLMNRTSFCEKLALGIVGNLVATIPPSNLLTYVNLTIPYIKDINTEHRELVYDILMKVYRKYSEDITTNDDAILQILRSISTENLLTGLLDPSQEIQDKILRFWTEETKLSTESSKNRLLELLTMHSWLRKTTSSSEDAFAPFVALLILQLTTKSRDYKKNMFDAPLHENYCNFENYTVAVSWRRRNLSYMTPMFVDSLASQMSYGTFSQISADADYSHDVNSYSRFSRHPNMPLRLRATQDLQFEPTLPDDDEVADITTAFEFDRTTIASSSRQSSRTTTTHRRPVRLLANSSDVANIIRHRQIQKNVQRAEMMKQESIKQRSSVRLYRDYRTGEFPDIEIPHSSLIVPLQQLIKLDRLICKDVTVLLICSLIEQTTERRSQQSDDFCQAVVDNLKKILHDSSERDSPFNAVILETMLQLNVTNCHPRDIAKISKTSRLDVLGALLLERSLLSVPQDDDLPTPSKKMRRHEHENTDKWVQLASLYKSLNDVDVVLSIFRRRQFFGDDMQEAAFAEVNNDWIQVKDAYKRAYKQFENRSMKEHCFQGLLEAVENLCDWSQIDQLVKERTYNGSLNGVWNDPWKDWMIPYACDAYVHMTAELNWASRDDDLPVIESWMNDRNKQKYLKHAVSKDLIMFLLMSEEQQRQATDLLSDLLDKMGEQWVGLNPLCTEQGIRESLKLQAMNDLNASLKVLRCANDANYLDRLAALLNFWSLKIPTVQDNLVQWNKLAAYRTYISRLFLNIFNDMEEDGDEDNYRKKCAIIEQIFQNSYQLRLSIADAALHQKHRYIAEKHLDYMDYNNRSKGIRWLEAKLKWLDARIKCLCADVEMDASRKMSDYIVSWTRLHELLQCDELDVDTKTAVWQHVGALASKIEVSSRKDTEFAHALASNVAILQDIRIKEPTYVVGLNISLQERLLQYSLNNLRECCKYAEQTAATNIGEHYCALARHCYGRLMSTDAENDELFYEFLSSTLKAMRHDYLEAAHYFPCLLRPERLQDQKTRDTFVHECAELRPWLFLRWQDLLFSHLTMSSIVTLIVPIVRRLVETYPDAVVYTYNQVIERNPGIRQDENIQPVDSLLRDKVDKYNKFLRAVQYVAQPELYLKHYLDEAMKDLSRGRVATVVIDSLLRNVYSNSREGNNDTRPGDIYRMISRYEREIRALKTENCDAIRNSIRRLKESLDKSLFKRASKNRLNDYSPFLHEYTGSDIEVPGQYVGDREPILRYHTRIARFEPRVAVMQSLRKPIRIGMVGDNGKEYKFLVKFGEDLTIDRGLQQLYATMNRTLRNDASCRQKRLAIDTYEVIPLSRSCGLIQWIEDTKSVEDLVRFTLSRTEIERCEKIREKYAMWIASATSPRRPRLADQYKEATSRYNWRMVTDQMERFVNETRRTALRDAFFAVSSSPECFATLRRSFVTSYATMCAAHWLAGVGDRHLQNTLVRVTTGRCLGIDFGHAFGGGIRAPVPELVPFRLTPQILELLRPFTERDLLATIMTHVMRALRDDRGPILACMDIFIHKPADRSNTNDDDDETTTRDDEDVDAGLTWSSKKNIEIVAKKLNGIHPSLITLEQLREAHDNEYFTRYYAIVIGDDGHVKQARANIRNDCLTPAEQVDCLLDQAKDFNILGRMYANWQSWL